MLLKQIAQTNFKLNIPRNQAYNYVLLKLFHKGERTRQFTEGEEGSVMSLFTGHQ